MYNQSGMYGYNPSYTFAGSTSNLTNQWQQYQNYPQQSYFPLQMQYPQQQLYYPLQMQNTYYPQQQPASNIVNNYYMGTAQTQQPVNYQQTNQIALMQNLVMGMFQSMMTGLLSMMSLSVQQPAQTEPAQNSMMNVFSNLFNMMNFSSLNNTSGNNITNIFNIIINGFQQPEPEEVFIVGGYKNCRHNLGKTIGNFTIQNAGGGHARDDKNDEMLDELLSNMSDDDKNLNFEEGYAYVISKDGEIIDKIATTQIVDSKSLARGSQNDEAEANDSFKILEDLGINTTSRTSSINDEENIGGQIELNGTTYNVASTLIRKSTPLILDLNGDGIDLTSYKDGVNFDLNGDGKTDKTAWTKSADDVFLVYDKDGNGEIDSGKELFGDQNGAENGFLELGKYDSNKDGKVDANDDVYSKLQTWSDANHNGKVDEGELKSLIDSNVKSLSTGFNKEYDETGKLKEDEHGNTIGLVGSFEKADGTKQEMIDALLQYIG